MKSIFEQLDATLLSKTRHLSALTSILRETLPPQSHGHFHVTRIDQHTLYVVTDSPVWATRLRQLAPDLLQTLRQRSEKNAPGRAGALIPENLQHLRVSTRPTQAQVPAAARASSVPDRRRNISQHSAAMLAQTAEYINDDRLSAALRRLSRHQKTR